MKPLRDPGREPYSKGFVRFAWGLATLISILFIAAFVRLLIEGAH